MPFAPEEQLNEAAVNGREIVLEFMTREDPDIPTGHVVLWDHQLQEYLFYTWGSIHGPNVIKKRSAQRLINAKDENERLEILDDMWEEIS